MTLLNFSTPNLVGGISQQVDQLKLPGQLTDCVNFIPSPVDALIRRNPAVLSGKTDTTAASACYVHWINRDATERYCVVVSDTLLRVFGLDGTEYLVRTPAGTATADFTYLNIATAADAPTKFRGLTVADYSFIVNREKTVSVDAAISTIYTNGEGYVFVRETNYNTLYTVTLKAVGGSDTTFKMYVGSGPTGEQQRFYSITALGAVATTWTFTFSGGATCSVTVGAADTIDSIHQRLANEINKIEPDYMTPVADAYGLLVGWSPSRNVAYGEGIPTLTNSGAGTSYNLEVQSALGTDKVAEALGALIDADGNWAASVVGSVIKVSKTGTAALIAKMETTDSVGGQALVAINHQVENVDDLPDTCTDGYQVLVVGGADAIEDDYWIKFVADETAAFGKGKWIETAAPGILYKMDEDTLPHQLIRTQNTALNTPVIGLAAGAIYFTFGPMTLEERAAGDQATAPYPFSGIPTINDVFFFKNRLGFVGGQDVILSESGRYFNFWRTTVRSVVDSDPIEITAANVRVSTLYSAVPFNDQLILWSDRTQYRLQGEPTLTPKTASIQPISEFQSIPDARPAATGQTLLFGSPHENYSGVFEYFPIGDGNRYGSVDTTINVPTLIPNDIREIVTCQAENTALIRSGLDSTIYLYRYLYNAQEKVQSAWAKFTLHTSKILGMEVYDSVLYLLVLSGSSSFICSLALDGANQIADLQNPHMDFLTTNSQIDPADITYDGTTDITTIVVPWTPQTLISGNVSPKTYTMLNRENDDDWGANIPILTTVTNTITVRGDWTARPFWVGSIAPASITLPTVYLRSQRQGGSGAIQAGTLRLRSGCVSYRNTGYFTVTVTQTGSRDPSVAEFSGYTVSETESDSIPLSTGKFRFPVQGLNDYTTITMETDAAWHVALIAIEWEAEYNARSTRYGG